ncbi:MAG TPA: hypothetical protein VML54_11710 [Candidatus Limnocylindrales bacterium]|nr:hypothetical protein [Candidatus Limnocylindrales bacterium]
MMEHHEADIIVAAPSSAPARSVESTAAYAQQMEARSQLDDVPRRGLPSEGGGHFDPTHREMPPGHYL